MISYDELLEAISRQFPRSFVQRAEGPPGLRIKRLRLATQALVARLARAGVDIEVQGSLPTSDVLIETAAGLSPETARTVGIGLPPLPPRAKCGPVAAALGMDLAIADAVVDRLWAAGLEHRRGGRYLYLDCKLGHGLRGLQLAFPDNEWTGLARRQVAVRWAREHVEGATFALLPEQLPTDAPDGSFDGVIAVEAFPGSLSWQSMQPWLGEIGRLVKPGGFAMLAVDGYARLIRSAARDIGRFAEFRTAYNELVASGRAALIDRDKPVCLYGPPSLVATSFGSDWLVDPPAIGAGPNSRDLYLARRRASSTAVEAPIEIAGSVEAVPLTAAVPGFGLMRAVRLAEAGRITRRAPLVVDGHAVVPDLRAQVASNHAKIHTDFPDRSLLHFADATVVGEGSVVLFDGKRHWLLADSAREFLKPGMVPKGMDAGNDPGSLVMPGHVHRTMDACCLLLQRPWSENFGHWLVDQAAALSYLVESRALPTRHIIVTKTDKLGLRQVMRQTIDAILPDAIVHEHDVGEVWRCRDLAYLTPVHVPPLFKLPAALQSLRKHLLPLASDPNAMPPTRRLHVLRSNAAGRQLLNEAEILQISARYGFETIVPEARSVREQARIFGEAESVIGVKGAALTNIIFAPPSCRVIVLSPGDFIDSFYWNIAGTHHAHYVEVFGALTERDRANSRNDFTIDPIRFEAALQQVLIA
jgi:capsular polysaccharide biosynthesis protein